MSHLTKLDNGIRIITDPVPTVGSVAIGAWFDVGARDENPEENGIAHLIEHMMFKGTRDRSAKVIAEEIENVGGQANAYTSREATAYFIHLLDKDVARALEILSDFLQHSVFDDKELERERNVVLQEIGMVQDTPDDLIFDCYQQHAFSKQSAGAPILGTPEIVSNMSREKIKSFVKENYTPDKLVISAAGNLDHDEIVTLTEKLFTDLPENKRTIRPKAEYTGGEYRQEKDLEQSHIILGLKGLEKTDDDYQTMNVFSTLLGEGMSSRLFQEVREKRGLVYSIYSFHLGLSDTGLFGVYAGTGPDKLDELVPVICHEIQDVAHNLKDSELARAKNQIKAEIIMGREKMMVRANQQARYLLTHGKVFTPDEIIQQIDSVTSENIRSTIENLLLTSPTLAAIGPVSGLSDYEKIKQTLAA